MWVTMNKGLLVFTGAGVSRESGIPTFVELGDLREKLSRTYFRNNPSGLFDILLMFKNKVKDANPNGAHVSIAECGCRVITMNIDSLHQKAGSKQVIDIHGNLDEVYCPQCGERHDFEHVRSQMKCESCNRIYEPEVVLYEDGLDRLPEALQWVDEAQHLLVVGTSFYTSTASYIVDRARRNGIEVTIINEKAAKKVPLFIKHYHEKTNL